MTTFALKILALIFMTIDHIGIFFVETREVYYIFRAIGRFSFPLFAFCSANGFKLTSNKEKLILRLLLFSLFAQPFYSLALGSYLKSFKLNVFWTFLFADCILWLNTNNKISKFLKLFSNLFIISILIILDIYNFVEYGIYGIACVLLFYYFGNKKELLIISIIVLNFINLIFTKNYLQMFSCVSLIFICMYNNEKGRSFKYLFYLYYPLHLVLLYLLNWVI